jgi:hypothetical protein
MKWPTVSFVNQPMTYQPEWRAEDEQRIQTLEALYIADGRANKEHPDHCLYTGLWQKHKDEQADVQEA